MDAPCSPETEFRIQRISAVGQHQSHSAEALCERSPGAGFSSSISERKVAELAFVQDSKEKHILIYYILCIYVYIYVYRYYIYIYMYIDIYICIYRFIRKKFERLQ